MILLALLAALTERAAATGAAGEACQGKCLNPRHAARGGSMRAFGANEME